MPPNFHEILSCTQNRTSRFSIVVSITNVCYISTIVKKRTHNKCMKREDSGIMNKNTLLKILSNYIDMSS
jgi:hypothetical protein